MKLSNAQQALLRMLPGVDHILEIAKTDHYLKNITKSVLVQSIRSVVENLRESIISDHTEITKNDLSEQLILEKVKNKVETALTPNLLHTINATGVVLHTNLGRSLLASSAIGNLAIIAGKYSNLEFNLSTGKRGSRYDIVENVLCEISTAEAAMVVNNNAGAVLLCLDTISKGKSVLVSRGELVEIGGSFRIPDVMQKSGCILKEVGTTNRTHIKDYENAIDDGTGLILKVHTSNYRIVGFTAEVSLKDLVALGKKYHIPVMEDLGSGSFIDFSKYGLSKEPTVMESVATGVDMITFSGDKLLGGPQAGIIVGKKNIIDSIKKNPLTRALRIDKLTLAALESTLRLYRDEETAIKAIPTLRLLTMPFDCIAEKAQKLHKMLKNIDDPRLNLRLINRSSRVGGGAFPLLDLPSKCIGTQVQGISANRIELYLRENIPPIIGRIEENLFIMDLRTILDDELKMIVTAFDNLLKKA
ncbi:MAG: L-seryl-tRNA(Sec) selenium transferase [Desulfobacterales bacterium]|nr:L-seryl-tRNA(Sec) selenium transferase [Desulfobacterales bacterium]